MDGDDLQFLAVGTGAAKREIAVRAAAGRGPMVLWCGGFRSDMGGTKAVHLAAWAASAGRAYVRFDYSGHGESEGRFEDGTIGRWAEEAQAVLDAFCPGETVVVGSSMGAGSRCCSPAPSWPSRGGSRAWCWWRPRPTSPRT